MGQYFGTISAEQWECGAVEAVFGALDAKRYIIGREHGRGGYLHYQYAVECSGDLSEYADTNSLGWHIEECQNFDKCWHYCQKEGDYRSITGTCADRACGQIRQWELKQTARDILASIEDQDDRQVTVWVDPQGRNGKTVALFQQLLKGRALPIPRSRIGVGRLSAWVCDAWDGEDIIWIDMPRNKRITDDLADELEEIKDGLVYDDRYGAKWRIVRGAKLLVTCNQPVPYSAWIALTEDRWDIHTTDGSKGYYDRPPPKKKKTSGAGDGT